MWLILMTFMEEVEASCCCFYKLFLQLGTMLIEQRHKCEESLVSQSNENVVEQKYLLQENQI